MTVTFAVIGRNEAPTLRTSLLQALDAAAPEDRVLFVDGGSSDRSVEIAEAMGVQVVRAGEGKGRAVAAAGRAAGEGATCTIDADIEWSERNIPAALRKGYADTGADMLVAHFVQRARVRTLIPGMYRPFVRELFPEAAGIAGPTPISGFRLLAPGRMPPALPEHYGVETFLNLHAALEGLRVEVIDVGRYEGPIKAYANIERMAADIAETILDLAEDRGRLAVAMRPAWDEWAKAIVDHARVLPVAVSERAAFEARLMDLAARPLPATHPSAVPR